MDPRDIAIADYDYPLPPERIAKYPLAERDHSKLLVYRHGEVKESRFYHIPDLLDKDTLLVFNNTKVIHARLFFRKESGAAIEIFCLEPYQTSISQAFEQQGHGVWLCFIGNNKKWKEGTLRRTLSIAEEEVTLTATRKEARGNAWVVEFAWTGTHTMADIIEHAGVIPLPPYLHRSAEPDDSIRYQTIYAEHDGSVAAPTAGLHFTDRVMQRLQQQGIGTEFVTLHVGAGTFKPVDSPTIQGHEMHVEKIMVDRQNLMHLLNHVGKPLIAVGTTSVRTLESLYWFGVQLATTPDMETMNIQQWDPYTLEASHLPLEQAYRNILSWMQQQQIDHFEGSTQLLIAPGYHYHAVNGIVTNFHQPKSTLLLLIAALIGEDWKRCYQYALAHDFRFLSYGDSCLLLP